MKLSVLSCHVPSTDSMLETVAAAAAAAALHCSVVLAMSLLH